jgi:hypothetical protein
MIITAQMLRDKGACSDQVAQFAELFPYGTRVNLRACRRAAKEELDLDWFADHFLTATALAAYKQATAPAWTAYKQAKAPALAAYKQATAPALADYEQAMAIALADYEQAMAPAWAAYKQAKATALVAAWKLQKAVRG